MRWCRARRASYGTLKKLLGVLDPTCRPLEIKRALMEPELQRAELLERREI
jgi:hypothetical protein